MPLALNANALVTLAQAKAELDIPTASTAEDDRVTGFVNMASDNIEAECMRKLKQATYTHYFDGSGTAYLKAYEFPVTSITSANVDDTGVFGAGTVVPSGDLVILRDIIFARRNGFWHALNPMNTKVVYIAGFSIIPTDLQQACLELVKLAYYSRNDRRIGIASKSKLGENAAFVTDALPPLVEQLIKAHRRPSYVSDQLEGITIGGV